MPIERFVYNIRLFEMAVVVLLCWRGSGEKEQKPKSWTDLDDAATTTKPSLLL